MIVPACNGAFNSLGVKKARRLSPRELHKLASGAASLSCLRFVYFISGAASAKISPARTTIKIISVCRDALPATMFADNVLARIGIDFTRAAKLDRDARESTTTVERIEPAHRSVWSRRSSSLPNATESDILRTLGAGRTMRGDGISRNVPQRAHRKFPLAASPRFDRRRRSGRIMATCATPRVPKRGCGRRGKEGEDDGGGEGEKRTNAGSPFPLLPPRRFLFFVFLVKKASFIRRTKRAC